MLLQYSMKNNVLRMLSLVTKHNYSKATWLTDLYNCASYTNMQQITANELCLSKFFIIKPRICHFTTTLFRD